MDPIICCLLGPCCPPFTREQHDDLVRLLVERYALSHMTADKMASDMVEAARPIVALLQPLVDEARKRRG